MKAIVYSVQSFEKELLAKANEKKHEITLISNALSPKTAYFAEGKDAVIVFTNDDVSASVIQKLKEYGVKYIATRSVGTDHIDRKAASAAGMKIANVPSYSPQSIAEHAITLIMALNRKLLSAHQQVLHFDFRLEGLQGFSLEGKTVGLIGWGAIAHALAKILSGFGCKVIAYDPYFKQKVKEAEMVNLEELYHLSDIISLHNPLNEETRHMIDEQSISKMKKGVMLINTSRGGLIDTKAVLEALKNGQVGYFGADVYEYESNLFFADHRMDVQKDPLLVELMKLQNVIITPHQAFLTREALQQIAMQTIKNLDSWQANKCVEKAYD